MYDSNLTNFLTGMALMASSMIKSPSYVTIDVYTKEGMNTGNFIKSTYTFDWILNELFYERKDIIETTSYLIKRKLGEPINVYEFNKKAFNKLERESTYYILEEAYVVEFDKYYGYMKIGNNE